MFGRLRQAVTQWYADRLLLKSAPPIPARIRQLHWASLNASEAGRNALQARMNEFQTLTGRPPSVPFLDMAQGGVTPEMLAGIPRPDRKSISYPAFAGMGHGRHPGLRRLPKPMPFNVRRFSETPPCRRAIDKIKNSLLRLDWEIAPLDEKYHKSPGRKADEIPLDMQQRIDAATRAMRNPNEDDSYLEVMTQVIEDVLVGGFGSLEVEPWEGNALQPWQAWPVPGESIRINMDWLGDDSEDINRAFRYSQALTYGGAAITTHEHVVFFDRQLLYIRYDPRTNTPFGLGPCEVAFQMINAWLGSMDARERMESNDIPPFLLQLGEDMSPDDVAFFRAYWENDIEGMGKIPIVGGTKSPEAIMLRMRQMGSALNAWPELILRMIAISFGLAPQSFGVERDVNRNTSDTLQSEEFADAVEPVAKVIEDGITQHMLWKICGWDDLEFKFNMTVSDEESATAISVQLYGADIATLNEAREKASLDPLPEDDQRGKMFCTEFRASVQAQYAPPAPPPGLDPMARLDQEDAAPPEQAGPGEPNGLGTTIPPEGAPAPDQWVGNGPVHAPPLGTPQAYAAADPRMAQLMALADQVRKELAASQFEHVGVVVDSEADFEALARLIATHSNGHA